MNNSRPIGACCILFSACLAASANAATTTYTDQASFLSALGSTAITQDFDSQTAPTIIADGGTLDGATYTYSLSRTGAPEIQIDNFFDTTSGDNYLGTDDGSGAFVGGDAFTISFGQTLRAIGLYVISADLILANDFTLTTNIGQSASNSDVADVNVNLSDGDAYFIGLIEDDLGLGFNAITLSSLEEEYLFNVDDVTVAPVPLPAAVWLFGSGLLGLAGIGRRSLDKA